MAELRKPSPARKPPWPRIAMPTPTIDPARDAGSASHCQAAGRMDLRDNPRFKTPSSGRVGGAAAMSLSRGGYQPRSTGLKRVPLSGLASECTVKRGGS
jgi:hypothetical protein